MTGVLGALSAQGSRTFVDELEDHNVRAASRRGTRADILGGFGEPLPDGSTQTLEGLGAQLFPHYRRLRIWHAARDLARRQVGRRPPASWPEGDDVWDYERIRRAAERAQQEVEDARRTNGASGAVPVTGIPYLPDHYPTAARPDAGPSWRWGVSGASSIAESVNELLRELVWMLPAGEDWAIARAACSWPTWREPTYKSACAASGRRRKAWTPRASAPRLRARWPRCWRVCRSRSKPAWTSSQIRHQRPPIRRKQLLKS